MSKVNEISKGTIGRYLKKTPASSADAGNKMAGQGMNPKASMQKGVKGIVKRSKGVSMAVDKMTGKAKVPATESFVIPEEIPANERTAFHGAAAAAAKSGKKTFEFGGKTHPVTMKKDTATKIADQKEGTDEAKRVVHSDKPDRLVTMKIKDPKKKSGETATMNPKLGNNRDSKSSEMEQKESLTIRDKLMMVLEGDRSKHYKGATPPEDMDNNLKGAGAKKMKADIQGNAADPDLEKKSHDDAAKAGRAGPSGKSRPNDKKDGDKKIINPPEDVTKKGKGNEAMKTESRNGLLSTLEAYRDMGILEAEGNVTSRHDVEADSKSSAIAAVRKKAGPNVAVKHHGMTPNNDHDISVTGHPKHVMKFVNHHEQGKYSLDHAGHAKYKKDFGM